MERSGTSPTGQSLRQQTETIKFRNMKILITGAAGFIGFSLARRLLDRGDTVVGIDNLNDYYPVALKRARLAEIQSPSTAATPWSASTTSTTITP